MIDLPDKKYKTLVIDPPWKLKIAKRKVRKNQQIFPYKTMTIDEIKQFPINDFADDECVLFLWTVQKYIKDSFEILEKWGFKFQIMLTWDKQDGMCMFGFHRRTEFVLFAYRGKQNIFPKRKAIPTIITEKSQGHSQKPSSFYELIRKAYPEPRIDIFSRKKHIGFDSYGDQAEDPTTLKVEREIDDLM